MSSPEFTDPRLVALHDELNGYGPGEQPDFYAQLAEDLASLRIIDFGCGTGLVSCHLADLGHDVTGIDPAPAMIAAARAKSSSVDWIVGGTDALAGMEADLGIMTGHVAQFFVEDAEWHEALTALRGVVAQEGSLAFESRNPEVREWEGWSGRRRVDVAGVGPVEVWTAVDSVDGDVVSFTTHYSLGGEVIRSPTRLRFRSREELEASLAGAGFSVTDIYGDWDRTPVGAASRELIFVARATQPAGVL